MPAASDIELYNFHEHFALAAYGVLTAAGVPCLPQRSTSNRAACVAAATFTLGPASDQEMAFIGSSTQQDYYRFTGCELLIELFCPRDDDEPITEETAAKFSYYSAVIRNAFRESKHPFVASNLPLYDVISIRPNGETITADAASGRDMVSFRYAVDFCIRSTAWPVGD